MRSSRLHWLLALFAAACAGSSSRQVEQTGTAGNGAEPTVVASEEVQERLPDEPPGTIPHYAGGTEAGLVSRESATRRGMTILDLGEAWVPTIFKEDESLGPTGRQAYRRRFVRLENEEVPEIQRDPTERYLELYGISPTLTVLRARLADEERHRCHEQIDNAPIEVLDQSLRPGADPESQQRRASAVRIIRRRLEAHVERRHLGSIDELEDHPRYGTDLRRLRQIEPIVRAIEAVQAHLRCEGNLPSRTRNGVLDAWTGRALRIFQSRHMIVSLASRLDDSTRLTMLVSSRELDFYALLRALRERVVDATGIIEDGSASNQWGTVLGRRLNLDDEFRWVDQLDPIPGGAPDLVSQQTEAAARALGWTDPASALAWLNEHAAARQDERLVALPLPAPPAYHAQHMDLRVEIHRGDVWYALPYTDEGRPRGFPVRRRPTTTIYAVHDGGETALVRWNTTIGGWQPEINPQGGVGLRYKESDVGPRVWRDLIAGPAWLPPPNTPDDELVRRRNGEWVVNDSITGPGYDSAYGLTMVIHHLVRNDGADESDWVDNGIRSHGSVSYRSILRGHSHGCHRLFNHLAVRMNGFLLNHRNHATRGRIPASLRRELHVEGSEETVTLELTTRGFLFELTPPVPVEVLRGNVRGQPTRPMAGFFPLPEALQAEARAELAADPATAN